jgi:hypothetical protein
MQISLVDCNYFVSLFYDQTKSACKVFQELENLEYTIGICDVQHYNIQKSLETIHQSRFKSLDNYNSSLYLLNDALDRYTRYANSKRVVRLRANIYFDLEMLSFEDKVKYLFLDSGGNDEYGKVVQACPCSTYLFKNCYHYSPKYFITQNQHILDSASSHNPGELRTFKETMIATAQEFFDQYLYSDF